MSNRLAHEKSPYLLQHADNPVAWLPWGEEAFAQARAENKPIFLSIGYSTCHWCHVMAHESFENEATAAIMNREFVNIKVDREERPDVDRVYMTFVQATTGERRLAHERVANAGAEAVCRRHLFSAGGSLRAAGISEECWSESRRPGSRITRRFPSRARASSRRCTEAASSPATGGDELGAATLETAYQQIARSYDAHEGGFGGAPKFPRPVMLNFLLRVYARESGDGRRESTRSRWCSSPCAKWRRAGCTIISAAGSRVTRWMPTGTCRTSKKCSTIRRNWRARISMRSRSRGSRCSKASRAMCSIMCGAT